MTGNPIIGARIVFFLLLILSAIYFPWWLTLFFSLFGIAYFSFFIEAIIIGLFIDSTKFSEPFFLTPFFFSIFLAVVLFFAPKFRAKINLGREDM